MREDILAPASIQCLLDPYRGLRVVENEKEVGLPASIATRRIELIGHTIVVMWFAHQFLTIPRQLQGKAIGPKYA